MDPQSLLPIFFCDSLTHQWQTIGVSIGHSDCWHSHDHQTRTDFWQQTCWLQSPLLNRYWCLRKKRLEILRRHWTFDHRWDWQHHFLQMEAGKKEREWNLVKNNKKTKTYFYNLFSYVYSTLFQDVVAAFYFFQ